MGILGISRSGGVSLGQLFELTKPFAMVETLQGTPSQYLRSEELSLPSFEVVIQRAVVDHMAAPSYRGTCSRYTHQHLMNIGTEESEQLSDLRASADKRN